MFQRGANTGLKRPWQTVTDFSTGGPTALDLMRPALDHEIDAALESAEEKRKSNKKVADHLEKRLRYDPYTSKLEEGWIHFRIPNSTITSQTGLIGS